jgi:glutaredoxin
MMMFRIACVLMGLSLAAGVTAETMYRWLDSEGKVHYSNQPPSSSVKNVEQKKLGANVIPTSEASYAMREAMKNFPVVLFGNHCGEPCSLGRALLEKRGVPYVEKNPEEQAAAEELKKLNGGKLEVPVLTVGSQAVRGYEEQRWHAALDAAGYPSSGGVKPHRPQKPEDPPAKPGAKESADTAEPAKPSS